MILISPLFRQSVGPIETLLDMGTERGLKAMIHPS